mgnify:CR=1 FL=1|jgi:hypothetical protein
MTLHDFVYLQVEEINRYKWIESEKVGYDLGDRAVFDWVENHAAGFRQRFQETTHGPIEYPNGQPAPSMDPAATITCSFGCRRIA